MLRSHLRHLRRDGAARTAPGRPEINEDGHIGAGDEHTKIGITVDSQHRAGGTHGTLTPTATSDFTKAHRGDAIALTTGRTREDCAWAHAAEGRHHPRSVNVTPRGAPDEFSQPSHEANAADAAVARDAAPRCPRHSAAASA
jgi:hypothetical protein